MPLHKCPDCNNEISTKAKACPVCARPVRRAAPTVAMFFAILILGVIVIATTEPSNQATNSGSETSYFGDGKSPVATSTGSQSAPQASGRPINSWPPFVGEHVEIPTNTWGCKNWEDVEAIISALVRDEQLGKHKLSIGLEAGGCALFRKGDKVVATEGGFASSRIRFENKFDEYWISR